MSYLKGDLRVEEGRTYNPEEYFRKPLLESELEKFKNFIAEIRKKIASENTE